MVSFRFSDEFRQAHPDLQQKWVQILLRAKGWIVPNYELAPELQNVEILRVVVRETMTAVMVDRLVADIVSQHSVSSQPSSDRYPFRLKLSRTWQRTTALPTL